MTKEIKDEEIIEAIEYLDNIPIPTKGRMLKIDSTGEEIREGIRRRLEYDGNCLRVKSGWVADEIMAFLDSQGRSAKGREGVALT